MSDTMTKPLNLRAEHFTGNILGLGTSTPRLSWQYDGVVPDGAQAVIQITRNMPGVSAIIETAEVDAVQNLLHPWQFAELRSREQVTVTIKLVTPSHSSGWSEELTFETGLLHPYEREAAFVGPSWLEGETDHRHLPLVRTEFRLKEAPVYARLYLSALGLVEAEVNGNKVGQDILTPGWTCYDHRIECWTYDITNDLHAGQNALGFWLGDGWYRGRIGFKGGQANLYGDRIGVFAQIEITYADGTCESIYSNSWDSTWKTAPGPILHSDLCEGETYDARLEAEGWSKANFDDRDWLPVAQIPFDNQKIQFPKLPPVRETGSHPIVSVSKLSEDANGKTSWLLDFGQNCTQRLRLHLHDLQSGDTVSIRHAEVLNQDGTLAMQPLRRGKQSDVFISNGQDAFWEPRFAIHGFQYAEISGWSGELSAEDVECRVYYSDMEPAGWFESSNQLVNRLHENVLWSMKSNFVSIPTDCPQRDERLGWTGDIALFAPTAAYLYEVSGFLSHWLEDVRHEQQRVGTVPFYVPYLRLAEWSNPQAIAIWGDAAVLVPWAIYMADGDKKQLKEHYYLAKAWVDEVRTYLSVDGVWDRKPQYVLGQLGDWLDPSAPADDPTLAITEKELVATAFFAYSCRLLASMVQELNVGADEGTYRKLAEHVKTGFVNRFVKANGLMTSDSQCAYALAIAFGLLDDQENLKSIAGNRLAELVRESDGKISTGFAGTPYVLPALTETGHLKEAYQLFLSEECPGWLYQIKMGGTTTWERWDSMLPDGTVNPGVMTSFNHYSLGSVADWMHATIGGLKPVEPGWEVFEVNPQPGGGIISAQTAHQTPFGRASVSWKLDKDMINIKITVPFGTTARVKLPRQDEILELSGGDHQIEAHY
ncbi:family 78 glycoside hydrolase catalytic domain [Paenibacillus sp. HN-1]|uniref:alpha-L-rhamnosidase n=1 Tax=Paenibacillus TaxID=44249 RepID=UPI001CA9D4F1|nr:MULTISPECIES: alpha-L-rhamnosidase [Paenibacillus]MBY9080721.1 family 78 glycoside hydrolase catalytic domain [Paenibacillus sp. CGMCC 1.18879]MBY9085287.1 family 78 glycoside hydrolase catalytic domain [Paenibacillus sinensis]